MDYYYIIGQLHGPYINYFNDGQKSIHGSYNYGKKNGIWVWNYKDGVTALSGEYKKDNPIGSWQWIRGNKSEMVTLFSPRKEWVNKRVSEWEKINNQ